MGSLYEMSKEFMDLVVNVDEDGCLNEGVEEDMNEMMGDIENKAKNIAIVLQMYDGEVDMYNKEIERLSKRKKSIVGNKDRLKKYLDNNLKNMNIDKMEVGTFKISYSKSEKVVVDEGFLLPDEYLTIKTTANPDKKKIKDFLKDGNVLEGCEIVVCKNLQIK